MQTITDIRGLLASRGLRPKKSLGQNFLHDQNHLRRILAAAEVGGGDLVLEVGPGTGVLTEPLLRAGARVVAVELDRELASILRDRLAVEGLADRLTLIEADVLAGKHELNPDVLAAMSGEHDNGRIEPFKLIANLPYGVASPLLINLAMMGNGESPMVRAVVMVQREVADRLVAMPGTKAYGPMTVLIRAFYTVRSLGSLPPSCFWPQPGVESAVVVLDRLDQPLTRDAAALSALVHVLFTRRRKQLGGILGRETPLPSGIDPDRRPDSLSVEDLVRLASGDVA